ncbi:MAG TPA: hypothetical protein VGB76_23055 [Pyrinomonadaceae bacterium]|jgi:hypothetical protein
MRQLTRVIQTFTRLFAYQLLTPTGVDASFRVLAVRLDNGDSAARI